MGMALSCLVTEVPMNLLRKMSAAIAHGFLQVAIPVTARHVFNEAFRSLQIAISLLWKIWIVLDLANLLDVPLGVSGNFQHPLPTIDDLCSVAKAVGA